jgi:hypothetical protein
MSFIYGMCRVCGYVYDAIAMVEAGCPACRATRVAKAFSPIDPLRTSLGISGKRPKTAEEYHPSTDANSYLRDGRLCTPHGEEPQTEIPEGCKMPVDEAAQVYELKRMRKLIGRL